MAKAPKYVIANWKENPATLKEAEKLFAETRKAAMDLKNVRTVVCAPAPYLFALAKANGKATRIAVGAQDVSKEEKGAHTGEVSAGMLQSAGAAYAIVGHSERRARGESDTDVAEKIILSLKEKLAPTLCIGEKARDRHGEYLSALADQIKNSLKGAPRNALSKMIIAYEPVWAIGRSAEDAMNPRELHETVIFVRKVLADCFDHANAMKVPILYGGSVEPGNALELIQEGNADGFLVGHASLKAQLFSKILSAVENAG